MFRASAFQSVCGQEAYGSGPLPVGAFWQLQFVCEMALLAPNLDPGLLRSSGHYKEVFQIKVFRVTVFQVFKASAFRGVCGPGAYGSGPVPFEALWQLQCSCEMAILVPNLDLGLWKPMPKPTLWLLKPGPGLALAVTF